MLNPNVMQEHVPLTSESMSMPNRGIANEVYVGNYSDAINTWSDINRKLSQKALYGAVYGAALKASSKRRKI